MYGGVIIKSKEFDILIEGMSKCEKCTSLKTQKGRDCSLINIYKDKKFSKKIPSVWTDWYNRLDSNILIIGQDWGPYSDMKRLNNEYLRDETIENWKRLIDSEKSITKKQLTKYLIESSNGKISTIDNIYITNAVMCARKGNDYRGNNINLKYSTLSCSKFLRKQIDIVKPKVILTLGYYPLLSLSNIYNFEIEDNLQKCIKNSPVITIKDFVIIPLYHPVAQVKKELQMEQYYRIWNFL